MIFLFCHFETAPNEAPKNTTFPIATLWALTAEGHHVDQLFWRPKATQPSIGETRSVHPGGGQPVRFNLNPFGAIETFDPQVVCGASPRPHPSTIAVYGDDFTGASDRVGFKVGALPLLHALWLRQRALLLREHQPVVAVPEELPDVAASIATCAGATVMAVIEQAGELRGKRVLVMGIDMLGLIAVDTAVRAGAAEVIATDLNETRLGWARKLGAVVPAGSDGAPVKPESVDVALEFSGSEFGVWICIESLGLGGRAGLAGSVATSPTYPLDPKWLVRGWRTVTGVHNYEPWHPA